MDTFTNNEFAPEYLATDSEPVVDVDTSVAASDVLAIWTENCALPSFTAPITSSTSRPEFIVDLETDKNLDTSIYCADGKLAFVSVDEPDVIRLRSPKQRTKNDQYRITLEATRTGSTSMLTRLKSIYAKAAQGATGKFLAEQAGLDTVNVENFTATWFVDLKFSFGRFVARPDTDFSSKRAFSVLVC